MNIKQISRFEGPEYSPGYLLWKISTTWRSSIEDVLHPFHLTHPQFVVLATLAWLTREGKPVSQIGLSRISGLDPNTLSLLLRTLEAKKYIKRNQKVDSRSKYPVMMPLGAEILSKALPAVERADSEFFQILKQGEVAQLVTLFNRLMR